MSNSNKLLIRKTELVEILGEQKSKALDLYASKELLGLSNEEVSQAVGASRSWFQQLKATAPAKEYLAIVNTIKAEELETGAGDASLYDALKVAQQHIFKEVSKGSVKYIELLLKMNETLERIETKQRKDIEQCDVDSILKDLEREFGQLDKCLNCKYKVNTSK